MVDVLEIQEWMIQALGAALDVPVEAWPEEIGDYVETRMAASTAVVLVGWQGFQMATEHEASDRESHAFVLSILYRTTGSPERGLAPLVKDVSDNVHYTRLKMDDSTPVVLRVQSGSIVGYYENLHLWEFAIQVNAAPLMQVYA